MRVRIKDAYCEISTYSDSLTRDEILKQANEIKEYFPQVSQKYIKMLIERINENGFTNQRFKDAVRNVIDTCKYPQPTISEFIQYDKCIKAYNKEQFRYRNRIERNVDPYKNVVPIRISNEVLYIQVEDFIKHKPIKLAFNIETLAEYIKKIERTEGFIRSGDISNNDRRLFALPQEAGISALRTLLGTMRYAVKHRNSNK